MCLGTAWLLRAGCSDVTQEGNGAKEEPESTRQKGEAGAEPDPGPHLLTTKDCST